MLIKSLSLPDPLGYIAISAFFVGVLEFSDGVRVTSEGYTCTQGRTRGISEISLPFGDSSMTTGVLLPLHGNMHPTAARHESLVSIRRKSTLRSPVGVLCCDSCYATWILGPSGTSELQLVADQNSFPRYEIDQLQGRSATIVRRKNILFPVRFA